MATLSRILCAVDFSPQSLAGVAHAMRLAREDHAEVHVIHVYSMPVLPFVEDAARFPDDFEPRMRARYEKALREVLVQHREPTVPTEHHLVSGRKAHSIVREARGLRCDLIVVGTTGKTGLPRFLLGSVAERVVRTSPIDVLVVPTVSPDPPPKHIGAILCAVDFSAASERAFSSALALASKHGSALHVVHAWHPSASVARSPQQLETHDRDACRELETLVQRHPATNVVARRHLRRGIAYVEIVALAGELGVDLVVTGAVGSSGLDDFLLGSVAERVVRASPVPVWTVRSRGAD